MNKPIDTSKFDAFILAHINDPDIRSHFSVYVHGMANAFDHLTAHLPKWIVDMFRPEFAQWTYSGLMALDQRYFLGLAGPLEPEVVVTVEYLYELPAGSLSRCNRRLRPPDPRAAGVAYFATTSGVCRDRLGGWGNPGFGNLVGKG